MALEFVDFNIAYQICESIWHQRWNPLSVTVSFVILNETPFYFPKSIICPLVVPSVIISCFWCSPRHCWKIRHLALNYGQYKTRILSNCFSAQFAQTESIVKNVNNGTVTKPLQLHCQHK